jgi:carbon storage regulator CsrA
MLVLQRLLNEEVIITCPDGTRITVVVIDILEHTVRLGFKAPLNYLIDRKEITDLKDKAQHTEPNSRTL